VADTANATDPYLSLREAIAVVNSPSLPDGLSDEILGQIAGTLHDGGADTISRATRTRRGSGSSTTRYHPAPGMIGMLSFVATTR
jgi:hypothetical protein